MIEGTKGPAAPWQSNTQVHPTGSYEETKGAEPRHHAPAFGSGSFNVGAMLNSVDNLLSSSKSNVLGAAHKIEGAAYHAADAAGHAAEVAMDALPLPEGLLGDKSEDGNPSGEAISGRSKSLGEFIADRKNWDQALREATMKHRDRIDDRMDRAIGLLVFFAIITLILAISFIEQSWVLDNYGLYPVKRAEVAYRAGPESGGAMDFMFHTQGDQVDSMQAGLGILSLIFACMLHRVYHLESANRDPVHYAQRWYKIDRPFAFFAEAALNFITSWPDLHPLMALGSVMTKSFYIFKLLRYVPSTNRHRKFQVRAGLIPPQTALVDFKAMLRKQPILIVLLNALVFGLLLSYCVLAVERWSLRLEGYDKINDLLGEAIFDIVYMIVIGEVYHNSENPGAKLIAIITAILAVILTTMIFTALMQTIEADSNLEAALDATALAQLAEDRQLAAVECIWCWYKLSKERKKGGAGGGDRDELNEGQGGAQEAAGRQITMSQEALAKLGEKADDHALIDQLGAPAFGSNKKGLKKTDSGHHLHLGHGHKERKLSVSKERKKKKAGEGLKLAAAKQRFKEMNKRYHESIDEHGGSSGMAATAQRMKDSVDDMDGRIKIFKTDTANRLITLRKMHLEGQKAASQQHATAMQSYTNHTEETQLMLGELEARLAARLNDTCSQLSRQLDGLKQAEEERSQRLQNLLADQIKATEELSSKQQVTNVDVSEISQFLRQLSTAQARTLMAVSSDSKKMTEEVGRLTGSTRSLTGARGVGSSLRGRLGTARDVLRSSGGGSGKQ